MSDYTFHIKKAILKISCSIAFGRFYGFKLHMVINEKGEIQGWQKVMLIPVPDLTKKLVGLLLGDKGYIQKDLFLQSLDRNLKLVTKIKKV